MIKVMMMTISPAVPGLCFVSEIATVTNICSSSSHQAAMMMMIMIVLLIMMMIMRMKIKRMRIMKIMMMMMMILTPSHKHSGSSGSQSKVLSLCCRGLHIKPAKICHYYHDHCNA